MRRFISAALAASFTLLILPTVQATVAGAAPCASDYTVLVGGTGDPSSSNVPFQTIGQPVRVQYPADVVRYDMSVAAGVRGTADAVAQIRRDCPGAKIHAVGYSLGAVAAGDYCNSDPSVSCTLVADPRRPGGLASYLPDLPGVTFGGARPVAGNIKSVCNEYDIICAANPSDPVRVAASALGYAAGIIGRSTHGYAPVVEPAGDVTISQPSPIPSTDEIPALPFVVPSPRDVVQPWVPERSMVAGGGYVPVPVEQFLPPAVNDVLPSVVRGWVPPPLPVIPGL